MIYPRTLPEVRRAVRAAEAYLVRARKAKGPLCAELCVLALRQAEQAELGWHFCSKRSAAKAEFAARGLAEKVDHEITDLLEDGQYDFVQYLAAQRKLELLDTVEGR